MLDTEESSSDEDADWVKLESKNPYLRLMTLGKAKTVMNQYLMQDIDGLDVKLLFGVYQRKVIGYEEKPQNFANILDKIITAKKQARQLVQMVPEPKQPEKDWKRASMDVDMQRPTPPTRLDLLDRLGNNHDSQRAGDESTLAQFTVKPNQSVDRELGQFNLPAIKKEYADYINNPVVHNGYNMSYEPYASKYDNK